MLLTIIILPCNYSHKYDIFFSQCLVAHAFRLSTRSVTLTPPPPSWGHMISTRLPRDSNPPLPLLGGVHDFPRKTILIAIFFVIFQLLILDRTRNWYA